ncbi:PAS domain S-box protein [Methanolobus bombayensis]|uniref:PAS domain S-box protein n=1 Tax=Methanolobus bombayensis TaxID=38023 RepID=UPI001AE6FDF5|nr:PAS domain S-box protein [Methanolobus bombayensis]MBP1910721.1 PAS domain-containing protein [Methanolobus bombayensis]
MDSILDIIKREINTNIEKENHVVKIPESIYRLLIESEIDCYCYVDKNGNFLEVSETYSKLVGYA